jgi:hypothetical protein
MRLIVSAERGARSTFVKLACGHERSFGGHVVQSRVSGRNLLIDDPRKLIGVEYDCQDGTCYRVPS